MNVRIFEKFKWFYNKSTLEKIVKELLVWISFWGLVKKKRKIMNMVKTLSIAEILVKNLSYAK